MDCDRITRRILGLVKPQPLFIQSTPKILLSGYLISVTNKCSLVVVILIIHDQWRIQDFPVGTATPKRCQHTIWPICSRKLHENEEILAQRAYIRQWWCCKIKYKTNSGTPWYLTSYSTILLLARSALFPASAITMLGLACLCNSFTHVFARPNVSFKLKENIHILLILPIFLSILSHWTQVQDLSILITGFPLLSSHEIPWLFQYFYHFSLTFSPKAQKCKLFYLWLQIRL